MELHLGVVRHIGVVQMLLIMLMLIEKKGRVDQLDFAARLHHWMRHGFTEFGDLGTHTHGSMQTQASDPPNAGTF